MREHLSDRELLEKIMGDLTALNAAVSQLQTDVDTLISDFTAASDQSEIDATTANVTALDTAVQSAIGAQGAQGTDSNPPLPS
jgi:outer membrane murein-binding lipoprotein Lpp